MLDDLSGQEARIEVSRIARERLRAAFPAHSNNVEVVALANGLDVAVDTGCSFGAEFFVGHLNEWRFLNAIIAHIPVGAKIVDVGANFGLYALHCAKAGGDSARVVALEPLPSAADLLERNVRDNKFADQVSVLRVAAGAKSGTATLFVAADGAFSGLHDTRRSTLKEKLDVQICALDQCAEVAALGPVDFLKIDVEGHEGSVLAGAHELIARSPGLLISLEYSHKNLTDKTRAEILAEIGYCIDAGYSALIASDQGNFNNISDTRKIPRSFAGTVLLAAPQCAWKDDVLMALDNSVSKKSQTGFQEAISFIVQRSKAALETAEAQRQLAARLGLDQAKDCKSLEKFVNTLKAGHDTLERRYAALMELQANETARNKALEAELAAGRKLLSEKQSVIDRIQIRSVALEGQLEAVRSKADQRGDALKLAKEQRDALQATQALRVRKIQDERDAAVERLEAVSATLDALRAQAERQNEKLERRAAALETAAEQQIRLKSANSELLERLAAAEAVQTAATQKLREERDAAVERLKAVSATLDALREQAERQNEKLERRAAALETAAEQQIRLKSANSELLERLAAAEAVQTAATQKLREERDAAVERLKAVSATLDALREQAERQNEKLERRAAALETAAEQQIRLKSANSELLERLAAAEAVQTAATQKLREERDAAVERLKAVSATLDALREQAERQNEKLERRAAALETAAEQQIRLKSANSELLERLAAAEAVQTAATQKLREERDAAVERLKAVSARSGRSQEQAERQNEKLERRAAALETAAEAQAKLQSANSELSATLSAARAELESERKQHSDHIRKLDIDLDGERKRVSEIEASLSVVSEEKRDLQSNIARTIDLHKQEVSVLRAVIDDAERAVLEAKQRGDQLHKQLAGKIEDLSALTTTVEALRTEFRQLQQRDALRALKRWRRS